VYFGAVSSDAFWKINPAVVARPRICLPRDNTVCPTNKIPSMENEFREFAVASSEPMLSGIHDRRRSRS